MIIPGDRQEGDMHTTLRDLQDQKQPRSIHDIDIDNRLKVLMLAPHPDDFDAIGVTLKTLKDNGNVIELAVVTTGSGVEDSYPNCTSIDEKAKIRELEQRRSCRFFGLDEARITFLDLLNDDHEQPKETSENIEILKQCIFEKQPDIVFLLHGNDTNTGHQRMYSMFNEIANKYTRPLTAFLIKDPKTIDIRIDVYSPFDQQQAKWKAELLRFHDTQHQRNLNTRGHGFDDRILNVNRNIASQLSLDAEFAEAFQIEYHKL